MPLIKVQTSVPAPEQIQIGDLLRSLSASLTKHLSKPESYVMTVFEPDTAMTFAGSFEPSCYVEVKSVGNMTAAQTSSMSQDFCQQIEQALEVPKNRIYIEFTNARGELWGWNGFTFG
ncbi:phenylpyruvate tautomerase MIF-related protein [Leptolyngbya sp. FACHB-261]|uniref:phenylpyruvate tautomerase MIF-related protein n=1 Tax=Leptolyngbya sp. FACHB-261 TaxID=2692806 RepID=UPI00168660FF|nr:phenylpyruvate tautomerase MIF-related protein [Leptolyngbya sp. FACHB-261]MBD2103888.1 hypothetical protein [Leptolyngbya sp. FACHB-261]